jgi:hypothetical protein
MPVEQFVKRKRTSFESLTVSWINLPCITCTEVAKKAAKDMIVSTVINDDGYTVHTLAPADLGTHYDVSRRSFNVSTSYQGRKL